MAFGNSIGSFGWGIRCVGLIGLLCLGAGGAEAGHKSSHLNGDFTESVALVDQLLVTAESVVHTKDIRVLDRLLVDHLYAANLRFVVPEKARNAMTKQQLNTTANLIRSALSRQICRRLNKRNLAEHQIFTRRIKYGRSHNVVIVPTIVTSNSSKITIRWYLVKTGDRFYVANVVVAGFNLMGRMKKEYDTFLKRYSYSPQGIAEFQLRLALSGEQRCS